MTHRGSWARVTMPRWLVRRLHSRLMRTDCIKARVGRRLMREKAAYLIRTER